MHKDKLYDRAETSLVIGQDLHEVFYIKDGKIIKTIIVDPLEFHSSGVSKEAFLLNKFKEKDNAL